MNNQTTNTEGGKMTTATFKRLPGHVRGNELYMAMQTMRSFYDTQKAGCDVNVDQLNSIIHQLEEIKKEVHTFNNGEEIPVSYQ